MRLKLVGALPRPSSEAAKDPTLLSLRLDDSKSRAPVVTHPVEILGLKSIPLTAVNQRKRSVLEQVKLHETEKFPQPEGILHNISWILINLIVNRHLVLLRKVKLPRLVKVEISCFSTGLKFV